MDRCVLCINDAPVEGDPVEEHDTDSNETGPPSLVDSSSDEDVRPQEADSDTQSDSSQEEVWQWLLREMGKGKGKGGGKGKGVWHLGLPVQ